MHLSRSSGLGAACPQQQRGRPGPAVQRIGWRPLPSRLLLAPLLAGQTSSSSSSFTDQARQFAESAQQRMQSFVQNQKLDKKASAAAEDAKKVAAQFAQETGEAARRTYLKIESEHNISERLDKTKRWVSETARDIDQEYSLRRRLKSSVDDAQRMLPTWKRQAAEFSSTQFGKASLTLLFVGLLFSGLLWQLLNVFWLLWWVSVPVSLYLASQRSKAAGGSSSAAPGAGSSGFSSSSSSGGSRWGGFGSSSSSGGRDVGSRGRYSDEGPVVDAEWTSLDENGSSSSSRRQR